MYRVGQKSKHPFHSYGVNNTKYAVLNMLWYTSRKLDELLSSIAVHKLTLL